MNLMLNIKKIMQRISTLRLGKLVVQQRYIAAASRYDLERIPSSLEDSAHLGRSYLIARGEPIVVGRIMADKK